MLKQFIFSFGLLLTLTAATAASAADIPVVSTTSANLRAGPAVSYPVVARLPAGSRLVLHGCLARYDWCDVSWGGNRGWLSAGYLNAIYRNAPVALTAIAAARLGVAIVAFDAGFWHRHYLGRPWYPRWRYYWRW